MWPCGVLAFLHAVWGQRKKTKVRHLLQRESDTWPKAPYNLWSSSWSAWANDTAAHYAPVYCLLKRTTGPAVQQADMNRPPQSATIIFHLVACKLLLIFWRALLQGVFDMGCRPSVVCLSSVTDVLWLNGARLGLAIGH